MTEPRLLSKGELEAMWKDWAGAEGSEDMEALLAHISALEKERDAADKRALEMCAVQEAEMQARMRAEADNADHVRFLRGIEALTSCDNTAEAIHVYLSSPHPGAALLEEHRKALEPLRAVVTGLAEEMEAAIREKEHPKGGMSVPFHGDFASAPPSMLNRLRWWARELRRALGGTPSALLVHARNEGLEKAAAYLDCKAPEQCDRRCPEARLADRIRAMKEPEE